MNTTTNDYEIKVFSPTEKKLKKELASNYHEALERTEEILAMCPECSVKILRVLFNSKYSTTKY